MSRLKVPKPLRWFDVRGRQVGTWAFMLNRLTALALTCYLILHLVVLNRLTQGAQAYDDFVLFAQLPLIKLGEVLLIAAVFLHGLNGLRVILVAFGIGLRNQKLLFGITLLVTVVASTLFGLRMFGE